MYPRFIIGEPCSRDHPNHIIHGHIKYYKLRICALDSSEILKIHNMTLKISLYYHTSN